MTLKGKLRIFAILPFAGVVLMTASFVSPGWVNFNVNFIEYRFLPIPPYEGPYEGYGSANSAHLTGGLWYYTVCVRDFIPNSDGFYDIFPKTGTRCHTGLNSYDFEERLYHGQKGHLMPGVQIMCSIAMFCAINGFIGTIVYTRREEKYRWTGLTAFINLSIAGGTYLAAIVNTATATPISPEVYYMDTKIYNVQYYCAWGLFLGGFGCVLVLVSALGHLYILFRNLHATKNDVNDYQTFKVANQGTILQFPYTSMVPPRCNKTFAFNAPFFNSLQDAATCPKEKKMTK